MPSYQLTLNKWAYFTSIVLIPTKGPNCTLQLNILTRKLIIKLYPLDN